ncbi:MAG: hypothetical protein E6G64_09010, partial [Actinobacteria bacterium]
MRLVLPLAAALVVVGVWRHPLLGVYLVFGSALLFEQFEILGITPLTGQTRIFQNISSYTPTPLRLSLADLLVLLTLASWAFRRGAAEEPAPRFGPLGLAVA